MFKTKIDSGQHRGKPRGDATIGTLEIDGVFQCHTLEDVQRAVKIREVTAIPAGNYAVRLGHSPKFSAGYQKRGLGKLLPRVEDVPGFDGILIHIGNYALDTDGCVLVGKWSKSLGNMIFSSKDAYVALHARLTAATDAIRLEIKDETGLSEAKLRHPPQELFQSLVETRDS